MSNAQDKLDFVLSELKRATFVDKESDPDMYWNEVQVACDNAADYACDLDTFIKQLIEYIES